MERHDERVYGLWHDGYGRWISDERGEIFASPHRRVMAAMRVNCGTDAEVREIGADGRPVPVDAPSELPKSYVLLRLDPGEGPVYFLVAADRYPWTDDESDTYYYEEHTCAVNWLDRVVEVASLGEADPHGLVSVIGRVAVDDKAGLDCLCDAAGCSRGSFDDYLGKQAQAPHADNRPGGGARTPREEP